MTPHKSKNMKKIEVLKRECKKLAGKFQYDSEKDGWKGKSYYRFAYDEHVFTVHEDDDLLKAWDNGDVHKIKLSIEDAGASFLNFTTRKDLIEEARFERIIADITNVNVRIEAVANPEELV